MTAGGLPVNACSKERLGQGLGLGLGLVSKLPDWSGRYFLQCQRLTNAFTGKPPAIMRKPLRAEPVVKN